MAIKLKGQVEFDENDDFIWLIKGKVNGRPFKPNDPVDKKQLVPGRLLQLFKQNKVAPLGSDGSLKRDVRDEKIEALERKLAALEGKLGNVPAGLSDRTVTADQVSNPTVPVVEKVAEVNLTKMLLATGDKDPIAAGPDDRRYAVLESVAVEPTKAVLDGEEFESVEAAVAAYNAAVSPTYTLEVSGAWGQIMKNGEPYGAKMRKKAAEAMLEELTGDQP